MCRHITLPFFTGIILYMRPANERRRYIATSSLIGREYQGRIWSKGWRKWIGKFEKKGGWKAGGLRLYFKHTIIIVYIFQPWFTSNTIFITCTVLYILNPLYNIVLKNLIWKKVQGAPPSNSALAYCNDPSGQKCSKTWVGYGGESWFVGEGRDLKFWCDLLKFSLFHSPISVAPRAVKQSNSSSNVNMLVFSNTWGNTCKYLYIGV